MILFVRFLLFIFVIQCCPSATPTEERVQQDIESLIEVELGKNTQLRFDDFAQIKNLSLSKWEIEGPYKSTKCGSSGYVFSTSVIRQIEKCVANTDSSLSVTLNEFRRQHAGKWRISKEYRNAENQIVTYKNMSMDVLGIEFDARFHGKSFKVRDGEFLVMHFNETFPGNSVCQLVKKETNESYNLNSEQYTFPKVNADIQHVGPCGFRMRVRGTSHGNWSLVGKFGWIEKRVRFEVIIDSLIKRPQTRLTSHFHFWYHGFVAHFSLEIEQPVSYWEVERPDGNILQSSNMSMRHMDVSFVTSDDNGTWKIRAALKNDSYLTEQNLNVTLFDFPQISYNSGIGENGSHILYVNVTSDWELSLKLKNQDGNISVGTKESTSDDCYIHKYADCDSNCEKTCILQQRFIVTIPMIPSDGIVDEFEISLDYNSFQINAFVNLNRNVLNKFERHPSHIWQHIQKRKYVASRKNFTVECTTSAPLRYCTLKNPTNETYIHSGSPLITHKNCTKNEGICSCIAIINNATELHSGVWTWEIVFMDNREVKSLVPILVLESLLIPEVRVLNGKIMEIELYCETPPSMYYKTIKYCEWYSPNGSRIVTDDWTKYIESKGENFCRLGLIGSREQYVGKWKCIAQLDENSSDKIYATLNIVWWTNLHYRFLAPWRSDTLFIHHSWKRNFQDNGASFTQLRMIIFEYINGQRCTVKNENGKVFDASLKLSHNYPRCYFVLNMTDVPDDVVTRKWEVSLDNGARYMRALITARIDDSQIRTEDISYVWYDVPERKVMKRGSHFEEYYRVSKRLKACTLMGPNSMSYNSPNILESDSQELLVRKKKFICEKTINNINDDHSGNWSLKFNFENGLTIEVLFPIHVMGSYIVLEAERTNNLNGDVKLHCRIPTTMYNSSISNCKWFGPDGEQISTNGTMKYIETGRYDVCSLELKGPSEEDFGTWKCSARVDGYSNLENATIKLSKTAISRNKYYKQREIGPRDVEPVRSSELRLMVEESLELICTASIGFFRNSFEWYDNDFRLVNPSERVKIYDLPRTRTHYRSALSISPTEKSDNKTYICSTRQRGGYSDTRIVSTNFTIEFRDSAPFILNTTMSGTEWNYVANTNAPDRITLKCYVGGLPKPLISWQWNGVKIDKLRIDLCNATFSNNDQELHIDASEKKCSGQYLCKAENHIGVVEAHQTINIEQESNSTANVVIEKISEDSSVTIFVVFIFILISSSLVIYYCSSDRKRLKAQITEVESAMRLDETQLGPLNPEEMLHEQADFLPYDYKRWEYPEENLEMGEQLGHGFFGIVMKATAPNILGDGKTTTVAVKKLQSCGRFSNDRRALEIELRILANLGKHSNVVNLLGACTKKASIGGLMVILEFCPLGSFLDYLRHKQSQFIDQIDPLTQTIDFSRNKSLVIHEVDPTIGTIHYSNIIPKKNENNYSSDVTRSRKLSNHPEDVRDINTWKTLDQTTVGTNSNRLVTEMNVANNHMDSFSTQNLLEWASQTASAMEYLSGKKILHGDLAARNILLTEERVAKVCDFGLARTIPEGHYYKEIGAAMPLKWMAIETIKKRKFSTQSDVWSFGIVLWESFSLGIDPYNEMNINEIIALLNDGERLEMPKYATQEIYEIMLRCWNSVPEERPCFSELVRDIKNMLEQKIG